MVFRENPLLGRKVFFLNPPMSIENAVVESLKNDEFEVYTIGDLGLAKPLLRLYENAICFIFIDDVLTLDGWYNFIKSFEDDPSLSSIFLGVISVKTKPKDQERFLMNLKLPGGFVMLDKKVDETRSQLEGILNINGARGVRQCVRLELSDSKDVNGYFAQGSQLYLFKLVDISPMGFAAVMPANMAGLFKKGYVLKNVSITMGRYSFVCAINIYGAKVQNGQCLLLATLVEGTSKEVKVKIHNFVFDHLQTRMKIIMSKLPHDFTDYSIRYKPDVDEVEDVEEAEEVVDDETVKDDDASKNDDAAKSENNDGEILKQVQNDGVVSQNDGVASQNDGTAGQSNETAGQSVEPASQNDEKIN